MHKHKFPDAIKEEEALMKTSDKDTLFSLNVTTSALSLTKNKTKTNTQCPGRNKLALLQMSSAAVVLKEYSTRELLQKYY